MAICIPQLGCGGADNETYGITFRVESISTGVDLISAFCKQGEVWGAKATHAEAELGNNRAGKTDVDIDFILESYTVSYEPVSENAVELDDYTEQKTFVLEGGGSTTLDVMLVPIEAKRLYGEDFTGATVHDSSVYIAHYTFEGKTENGEPLSAGGDLTFTMTGATGEGTCE